MVHDNKKLGCGKQLPHQQCTQSNGSKLSGGEVYIVRGCIWDIGDGRCHKHTFHSRIVFHSGGGV